MFLNKKGFSLVEVLVAIAIVAIIFGFAIPTVGKFYRTYKFEEYGGSVESLLKLAKLIAMEKSISVGICVQGNSLKLIDMGTRRSDTCTGNSLKTLQIKESFITLIQRSELNAGLAFDARGFAIFSGSVCITDGAKYNKFSLQTNRGVIIKEKGIGGCP